MEVLPPMKTVHHTLYLKCQSLLISKSIKPHRYFDFKTLFHYHRNNSFHKVITHTLGTKIYKLGQYDSDNLVLDRGLKNYGSKCKPKISFGLDKIEKGKNFNSC